MWVFSGKRNWWCYLERYRCLDCSMWLSMSNGLKYREKKPCWHLDHISSSTMRIIMIWSLTEKLIFIIFSPGHWFASFLSLLRAASLFWNQFVRSSNTLKLSSKSGSSTSLNFYFFLSFRISFHMLAAQCQRIELVTSFINVTKAHMSGTFFR